MGIVIIDYGLGNLRSVSKALEAVGAKVEVTNDPDKISKAKAIVLPGVGAFQRGMENLCRINVLPFLVKAIKDGKPFLGICLGLQLLFTESEEYGVHRGLDIIKGRVKRFESNMKVPHMGWNSIEFKVSSSKFKVFDGIPSKSYFYFVHSYYAEPQDEAIVVATTEYGQEFVSAVNKNNIWGVQFHPEKSAKLGLKLLENFCRDVR
jgi:glutamine amidotransferase